MTWHATQAGWDAGCSVATLQSSTMGFGVYEWMGFQQVCTYHLYTKAAEEETPQPDA